MQLSQGSMKLIDDVVKKAYEGKVMLPDFQRNFVWARSDVEDLFKSLLENMFIGTFLIHHINPDNPPFKVIPIEGVKHVNSDFTPRSISIIGATVTFLLSIIASKYSIYEKNKYINLLEVEFPHVEAFLNINKRFNMQAILKLKSLVESKFSYEIVCINEHSGSSHTLISKNFKAYFLLNI